jgi:hypothetical protein
VKPDPVPTIVFGAFDRHNFGDMLFPHIIAALLPDAPLVFAGLARRDLRAYGGPDTVSLAQAAHDYRSRPIKLLHAGGELLTCSAWQSAVMLLPPERAAQTVAYLGSRPQERQAFARQMLGLPACAPYTAGRELFPEAQAIVYNAVGGVDLCDGDADLRDEVLARLRDADLVAVRDRRTHDCLSGAGIASHLLPDPAVMVAALFGAKITAQAGRGECAAIRSAFPDGYIAVQFSADFGDDATLAALAGQLEQVAQATGFGIALFRAGAAPWHDELDCYERLRQQLRNRCVRIFRSLDLWDICALIAGSRAYCGSSLHGRIVAIAYGLPRLNLCAAIQGTQGKIAAFTSTWDDPVLPGIVPVAQLAQALQQALRIPPEQLRRRAAILVDAYRNGVGDIVTLLCR